MNPNYSEHFFLYRLLGIILIYCISIFLFYFKNKSKAYLILLFTGAFLFFISAMFTEPYLHPWDERFHALVAKNMMNNPFEPCLYCSDFVEMNYDTWDKATIWLHKQPLFLWQIALSMKIFGANEFAVRFPSAILAFFLVIITYRSAKILFNDTVAYYSSLLIACSFYLFELVSGNQGMEHNDVAFLFYVSASIWAWLEYYRTRKRHWLILIGLFSGFAILCKWLVGLIVYSGWSVWIVLENRKQLKEYFNIMIAVLVTAVVSLPWQLYILTNFPVEAQKEFGYNSLHLVKAVEGHSGPFWWHFSNIPLLFGICSAILIPIGIISILYHSTKRRFKIALIIIPLIGYLFFSVAATKMMSYPFVTVMPIFIIYGHGIFIIETQIKLLKIKPFFSTLFIFIGVCTLIMVQLNIKELIFRHTDNDKMTALIHKALNENKDNFLYIGENFPKESLVFNVKGRYYIDCMFYSGCKCYSKSPTEKELNDFHNSGLQVISFHSKKNPAPEHVLKDNQVFIIEKEIKGGN